MIVIPFIKFKIKSTLHVKMWGAFLMQKLIKFNISTWWKSRKDTVQKSDGERNTDNKLKG